MTQKKGVFCCCTCCHLHTPQNQVGPNLAGLPERTGFGIRGGYQSYKKAALFLNGVLVILLYSFFLWVPDLHRTLSLHSRPPRRNSAGRNGDPYQRSPYGESLAPCRPATPFDDGNHGMGTGGFHPSCNTIYWIPSKALAVAILSLRYGSSLSPLRINSTCCECFCTRAPSAVHIFGLVMFIDS